jgi:integrase
MEQLGHSQVALTLNRYTHVPSALMEEAAKAMDRALGS